MFGAFSNRNEAKKELRFTKDLFMQEVFAIVASKAGQADAADVQRSGIEDLLMAGTGAYVADSLSRCVDAGRKFQLPQDLVAMAHGAVAALQTARLLLGLPQPASRDERKSVYIASMPSAVWLCGDTLRDEVIWEVCDAALKDSKANDDNMGAVNEAFSHDFQDYIGSRGEYGAVFLLRYLVLLDKADVVSRST